MAPGKRASMREGPLAALFRKTTEDTEPGSGEFEPEAGVRSDPDAAPPHGEFDAPPADVARRAREVTQRARDAEQRARDAARGRREAAQPAPEAAKPAREAARPAREAAKPARDAAKPAREAAQPAAEAAPARRRPVTAPPDPNPVAGAGDAPASTGKMPTPQERLRHVFSSDIPMNLLDRMPAEPPEPPPDVYARPERAGEAFLKPTRTVGSPVLRVVGVGGAGVNAVNRMVEAELEGIEFLAINTDLQSLQQSAAHDTLHIGDGITRGLGSGSNPDLGRRAAVSEHDRIKALLRGSDMVFIAAGAGGGTGTGAAPIVAQIARSLGALTVGIVTRPFQFEGTRRREQAEAGIEALAEEVDTLIVVPNNRLLSVLDRNTSMVEAFRVADDVLRQGVQGISDLVTLPGLINLDFADVRTIMSNAGNALLGIGLGSGERRAIDAAEQAVASPLLETSMDGAHSILLSITGGRDLSLWEVNESAKAVAAAAHPDANIIFGAMVDEKLEDQVWVTVVATGFADDRQRSRRDERRPAGLRVAEPDRRPTRGDDRERERERRPARIDDGDRDRDRDRGALREPRGEPRVSRGRERSRNTAFDLDVPEFIPRR
jgi:cell division protein FtsZ